MLVAYQRYVSDISRAECNKGDLTLIWLTVVKEKTVSLPLFEFEKDCIGYCSRA